MIHTTKGLMDGRSTHRHQTSKGETMAGWKDVVKAIAPALGTALGGPLIGTAVKVLGDKLLGNPDATEEEVAKAVEAGLPPDTLVKLREIDADFKLKMEAAALDLKKLEADTERSYLADTQDARKANAGNNGTFKMGVAILTTFFVLMALVLFACYRILTKGMLIHDPGTAAVVFTLVGTIVGYVASNAQTVVNFEFGTSRGSAKKSDDMASAIQEFAKNKT